MSHVQALAFYKQKKYEKAFLIWKEEASRGNDQAMVNIGLLYLKGEGVAQDPVLSKDWFEQAIIYNNASAYYNVALMYQNAIGVEKDDALTLTYFKHAASNGHIGANFRLALMLLDKKDNIDLLKEGFEYLLFAAKNGHPMAMAKIGGIGRNVELPKEQYNEIFRSKSNETQFTMIQEAIDEHIKPTLLKDGGDILLLEVKNMQNIEIRMLYMGSCSGCSLSTTGTYEMIRNILTVLIDEGIEIYAA
ncbi:MAG: NifU family protein [Sulfurovaceae bacterium]|nr:NifU family protein [Sulfurovaceae bacterium]